MYAYKLFKLTNSIKDKDSFKRNIIDIMQGDIWIDENTEEMSVALEGMKNSRFMLVRVLKNEPQTAFYYERVEGKTMSKQSFYKETRTTHMFVPLEESDHGFVIGKGKVSDATLTLAEGFGYKEIGKDLSAIFIFPSYNLAKIAKDFGELWNHSFKKRKQGIGSGSFHGIFKYNDAEVSTFSKNSETHSIGIKVKSFNKESKVRIYSDGRIQVMGLMHPTDRVTIARVLDIARQLEQYEC
jgi:hypothetical protein